MLDAGVGEVSPLPPLVLDTRLGDQRRDPKSGVIAIDELRQATEKVRAATANALLRGDRPLLLGGDCAVLPGALAAAAEAMPGLRLLYLDGHPDACDGVTSPPNGSRWSATAAQPPPTSSSRTDGR